MKCRLNAKFGVCNSSAPDIISPLKCMVERSNVPIPHSALQGASSLRRTRNEALELNNKPVALRQKLHLLALKRVHGAAEGQ